MNHLRGDKKLSELLKELKTEYLQKLPGKIAKLKKLNSELAWKELEIELHKLKGNGKTYGYPEISYICEKLEFLAQHRETQIPGLFLQAIELLDRMLESYLQKKPFDLDEDSTMKAIMKLRSQTETKWKKEE